MGMGFLMICLCEWTFSLHSDETGIIEDAGDVVSSFSSVDLKVCFCRDGDINFVDHRVGHDLLSEVKASNTAARLKLGILLPNVDNSSL